MEVTFDNSLNGILVFPNSFVERVKYLGVWDERIPSGGATIVPAFGSKIGSISLISTVILDFVNYQQALDNFITQLNNSSDSIGYFAIRNISSDQSDIYWQLGDSLDWQNNRTKLDTSSQTWIDNNDYGNLAADLSLNLLDRNYIFPVIGGSQENAVYRIDLSVLPNSQFALQHSPSRLLDYKYQVIDSDPDGYYIKVKGWSNYSETIEATREHFSDKYQVIQTNGNDINYINISTFQNLVFSLNMDQNLIDNYLFVEENENGDGLNWYKDISENLYNYQYTEENGYFKIETVK